MKKKIIKVGDVFFAPASDFCINYIDPYLTNSNNLCHSLDFKINPFRTIGEIYAYKYLGEGYVEELSTGMKLRVVTYKYNTSLEIDGLCVNDQNYQVPLALYNGIFETFKHDKKDPYSLKSFKYERYRCCKTNGKIYNKYFPFNENENNEILSEKLILTNDEYKKIFNEYHEFSINNPIYLYTDISHILEVNDENKEEYLRYPDEFRKYMLSRYIELGRKYYIDSYNKAFNKEELNNNDNIDDIQKMAELENKLYDFDKSKSLCRK